MIAGSKPGSLKPRVFTTTNNTVLLEPKSYTEAHGVLEWKEAMRKEYKALIDNKT